MQPGQLLAESLLQRVRRAGEQFMAGMGHGNPNRTPVDPVAGARHQAAPLETVEDPRKGRLADVQRPRERRNGDIAVTGRLAECRQLRTGQSVFLEQLSGMQIDGADDATDGRHDPVFYAQQVVQSVSNSGNLTARPLKRGVCGRPITSIVQK